MKNNGGIFMENINFVQSVLEHTGSLKIKYQ